MKTIPIKFLLTFCICLSLTRVVAQDYPTVVNFKLKNGLEVFLCEDHTRPEVWGSVVVKAGSKYDPADATGMGHYLEHMLFKGTDDLGTTDFEKEKVYLEEIRILYDQLGQTTDEDERENIQKQINEASVKAAEFAIPNETDRLLKSIGGDNVNAYTSFEEIVYYNSFAPHQIEKWLDLYAERFTNPQFRLFQSELEVVYEEKNRASDEFIFALVTEFLHQVFKNHPYGRPMIGETEHLKNPSLSEMQEYFDKYYVANNMALVISGDIKPAELRPIIEKKFAHWRTGEVPQFPEYKEEPFNGREVVTKRLTPIKVGAFAFRTVPSTHEDAYVLDVLSYILSNSSETGMLDELRQEKKIQFVVGQNMSLNDHGAIIVMYLPKIIGQSHGKSEKLINGVLKDLRNGNIDSSLITAARNNLMMQFQRNFESNYQKSYYMKDCFIRGISWEEFLQYPDKISTITKEQIVSAANKYMNSNYLLFRSKMGFPKKDKIEKPKFEPVKPKEDSIKSAYAVQFEKLPEQEPSPRFIDFKEDAAYDTRPNGLEIYATPNPVNDVFTLTIEYPVGNYRMEGVAHAADYLNYVGTQRLSAKEFKSKMDQLGCTYSFSADDMNFKVYLSGLDKNLDESIILINELIATPAVDEEKLELMISDEKTNRRIEMASASSAGSILLQYVLKGDKSSYLTRYDKKKLKRLTPQELITTATLVTKLPPTVHYVGNHNLREVSALLEGDGAVVELTEEMQEHQSYMKSYSEPTIFILNKGNARQSHIYLYAKGSEFERDQIPQMEAFNSYFGGDMSSLVFQEIREYRSLAYAAKCYYAVASHPWESNYLYGYIGCQGDKTGETITTMMDLLKNMPRKAERMNDIKTGLMNKAYSEYPFFRSISKTIDHWKEFGYEEDPNKELVSLYDDITFDDVYKFYRAEVQRLPVTIAIVAKKKNLDMEELTKYGKIVELKKRDIRVK